MVGHELICTLGHFILVPVDISELQKSILARIFC